MLFVPQYDVSIINGVRNIILLFKAPFESDVFTSVRLCVHASLPVNIILFSPVIFMVLCLFVTGEK